MLPTFISHLDCCYQTFISNVSQLCGLIFVLPSILLFLLLPLHEKKCIRPHIEILLIKLQQCHELHSNGD